MTGHKLQLVLAVTDFTAYAVSVFDADVEQCALACGLIVCACSLEQVAEVVELMAEDFNLLPSLVASPVVGFRRRLGACGI